MPTLMYIRRKKLTDDLVQGHFDTIHPPKLRDELAAVLGEPVDNSWYLNTNSGEVVVVINDPSADLNQVDAVCKAHFLEDHSGYDPISYAKEKRKLKIKARLDEATTIAALKKIIEEELI